MGFWGPEAHAQSYIPDSREHRKLKKQLKFCGNLRSQWCDNQTWMTAEMGTEESQSQSVLASIYTDNRWAKLSRRSWVKASVLVRPCIWFKDLACREKVGVYWDVLDVMAGLSRTLTGPCSSHLDLEACPCTVNFEFSTWGCFHSFIYTLCYLLFIHHFICSLKM